MTNTKKNKRKARKRNTPKKIFSYIDEKLKENSSSGSTVTDSTKSPEANIKERKESNSLFGRVIKNKVMNPKSLHPLGSKSFESSQLQKYSFTQENNSTNCDDSISTIGNHSNDLHHDFSNDSSKISCATHSTYNTKTSEESTQSTTSRNDSNRSWTSHSVGRRNISIITLDELMSDNPRRRNTLIALKILRVIATTQKTDMFTIRSYKNRSNESKCAYLRLFLCLDVNSRNGQTVYIGEGKGIGINLWSKIANVRDDGTCGVGSTVMIYCPGPITKLLANEIPIIESNSSLSLCKREERPNILIDLEISENVTRGFILNGCELKVLVAEVLNTNCAGYFCDRQRTLETLRTGKKCGCYTMRGNNSKLSIVQTIEFKDPESSKVFKVEDFSSLKFSLLYLSQYFPKSVQRSSFDPLSPNHDKLYDCIDEIVDYYNHNGGFTVIGWYKRGEINDIIQEENTKSDKVTASTINYHVTSIYPSSFIHEEPDVIQRMKFDVCCI